MQDLSAVPKFLSSGSLRGSGWKSSLANPNFGTFRKNAYLGTGRDFGGRIPPAPVVGQPDKAITAERLHNAQIYEGLSAGPNRLTEGRSYLSVDHGGADGLAGGFTWGGFGTLVQKIAIAPFLPMIAPIGAFNPNLLSKVTGGLLNPAQSRIAGITDIAVGGVALGIANPGLFASVGKFLPAALPILQKVAGLMPGNSSPLMGATQGYQPSSPYSMVPGATAQPTPQPGQAPNSSISPGSPSPPQIPGTPDGTQAADILGGINPLYIAAAVAAFLLLPKSSGPYDSEGAPVAKPRRRRKAEARA